MHAGPAEGLPAAGVMQSSGCNVPRCPTCHKKMEPHCPGECLWAWCKTCGTVYDLRNGHTVRYDTKSVPRRTQT